MEFYPVKKSWRDSIEDPQRSIYRNLPDMLAEHGTAREDKRKAALHMPDMRYGDGWEDRK